MKSAARLNPSLKASHDSIAFFGHPMVRSSHRSTIEVTKDPRLTINGDCIIGVRADKGLGELSSVLKDALRTEGSRVDFTIRALSYEFAFQAFGTPLLTLVNPHEMVIRKSDYVCGRTLAIRSNAAARDIPRELVQSLRSSDTKGTLRIEVRS